jgi:uncharacterized protein YjiS (DUF1127 family)
MSIALRHGTLSSYRTDQPASGRMNRKGEDQMLVAIINFLQSWRRYNASLNELSQLGDRELADIGISRSDIPRVANR